METKFRAPHDVVSVAVSTQVESDALLEDTLRQLTEAAGRVSRLAPVDDDLAFRACLLVLTRAFDLSHLRDGLNSALVPVADPRSLARASA